jgi:hypothetical protein
MDDCGPRISPRTGNKAKYPLTELRDAIEPYWPLLSRADQEFTHFIRSDRNFKTN